MSSIYWIRYSGTSHVAIVPRPEEGDRLPDDLAALRRGGIDTLVSLLEPHEAEHLGLRDEQRHAESLGMRFVSYPIADTTTPADLRSFRALVEELAEEVREGRKIGVHCRGCIGRSTVLVARILGSLGVAPAKALPLIEEARGCPVPDTEEQRRWILAS
jgi:protein-tyrosine phosphatase